MGVGRGRLENGEALSFILAGNARFTVVNRETGNRFTFRVRQPKETTPHFVSVLSGPDNGSDYGFLGSVFGGKRYRHGRKSRISSDATSDRVFRWLFERLVSDPTAIPGNVEIWHEGRCGRCGRVLTVPASIATGIGPVCAGKI